MDATFHSPVDAGPFSGILEVNPSLALVWRERLNYVRIALGALGGALYIWDHTLPGSWGLAVALGCYAAWALTVAVSRTANRTQPPLLYLAADTGAFLAIAAHPSEPGVWMASFAYFFLMLHAGLLYHWILVGIVSVSIVLVMWVVHPRPTFRIWPAFALGGALSIALAVQRRAIEIRLGNALRRSVLSRSEAELAREQERQRIAADFHDGPLQSFIGFQMRLEIIRKLMQRNPEDAMRELVTLQDLGRAQVTELRAFVRGMQPGEVTPGTLNAAIREAVEHFERDSGIRTELFCGDLSRLHESMTLEVLQIVREILNNARKHSKASRIRLEVDTERDNLAIRANDDGSGFPFSGSYSLDELELLRMGPKSIQRRVRTLGGDMRLESRPTEGASLNVQIPVHR